MKKLQVILLAMFVLNIFLATAATNVADEEKQVQIEAVSADKLQIDVWWEVKEDDYGDGIVYHYIIIENKTDRHVIVYLVYTDNEGEHELTLHSQTWSDGGFKTRVNTKGRATVNKKESRAQYM